MLRPYYHPEEISQMITDFQEAGITGFNVQNGAFNKFFPEAANTTRAAVRLQLANHPGPVVVTMNSDFSLGRNHKHIERPKFTADRRMNLVCGMLRDHFQNQAQVIGLFYHGESHEQEIKELKVAGISPLSYFKYNYGFPGVPTIGGHELFETVYAAPFPRVPDYKYHQILLAQEGRDKQEGDNITVVNMFDTPIVINDEQAERTYEIEPTLDSNGQPYLSSEKTPDSPYAPYFPAEHLRLDLEQ